MLTETPPVLSMDGPYIGDIDISGLLLGAHIIAPPLVIGALVVAELLITELIAGENIDIGADEDIDR